MKLFLPSARATNWLLVVGFSAVGYALYLRYLGMELNSVSQLCETGANTWMCMSRRVASALLNNYVFGIAALAIAALNLLRPSLVLFGAGIAAAGVGVVLYNTGLSSLAAGLLVLSLARRASEPE